MRERYRKGSLITTAKEWFEQGNRVGNYWGTEIPQEGYVYVFEDRGVYKIGCARDPDDRLRCLGIKFPYPLKEIARIPTVDKYGAEKMLHYEFQEKRVGGEWFELDEDDVILLMGLAEEVYDKGQEGINLWFPQEGDEPEDWAETEYGLLYYKPAGHPDERYPTIEYFDWE